MHKAWCGIEDLPYRFSRSSVKFQGHTAQNIVDFDLYWSFPGCKSSLNSPTKWCIKLEAAYKRCPIVFQGHLSNIKVTQEKKSMIFTRIWRFRAVTPVWIHWWLWIGAQSFPDSKVHGANMGPTWVLLAPGGLHVGPLNLAIRVAVV